MTTAGVRPHRALPAMVLIRSARACLLLALCAASVPVFAAEAGTVDARAQWSRMMGQSGLRRFYSTGAELGELINRQVSYQTARRLQSGSGAETAAESQVEGFVAQYDSLYEVGTGLPRPLFLRALARVAKRLEPDKLHSRNDRYDLGVVYASSARAFVGFGLGLEQTRVDLKYVQGSTRLDAFGPRVDAGLALRPWLALGLRAEDLHFSGNNTVTIGSANGPLAVQRELDYRRRYVQLESIVRLTRTQVPALPAGWQLGGTAAVQYLDSHYQSRRNSLGQLVQEPFGNQERLGVLRTGLFLQAAVGANASWNPYTEILVDHEFETNMERPLSARTSLLLRTGLAHTFGPGKRLSLEYQRSQSSNGARERDNLILLLVMDF